MKYLEMNFISAAEYAFIQATMKVVFEKRFDCNFCKKQYRGRPDQEAMTQKRRKVMGCFDIADKPIYTIENVKYSTCIGNFYSPAVMEYVQMLRMYDQGVMPYEGSIMDQPHKVVQLMQILDDIKRNYQKEEAEKQARLAKRSRKI